MDDEKSGRGWPNKRGEGREDQGGLFICLSTGSQSVFGILNGKRIEEKHSSTISHGQLGSTVLTGVKLLFSLTN